MNSNDSPTRDILKDYSGQGHDIQLYNFGYAGMSGYGGYNDFYNWSKYINSYIDATYNYSTLTITKIKNRGGFLNLALENITTEQKPVKFLIKGLEKDNVSIVFRYVNPDDLESLLTLTISKDGIFEAPVNKVPTLNGANNKFWIGFGNFLESSVKDNLNITIEKIPDYPGALVSDGVDDYGLCENFPILTKEKGYTIVAIRTWLSEHTSTNYSALLGNGVWGTDGAFTFEYHHASKNTISFRGLTTVNEYPDLFSYQTSSKYNDKRISIGEGLGSDKLSLFIPSITLKSKPCSIVLYALEIYNRDLTDEEIQNVKEAMYNEYLTATNALQNHIIADYECYDKTNEDEDRNVLKDLSGNGHDITLYNFGFAEGSGYGKYVHNFNSWSHPDQRVVCTVSNNSAIITQVKQTTAIGLFYQKTDPDYVGALAVTSPEFKIKVSGITDGQVVRYQFGSNKLLIEKDGIYTLPSYTYNATQSGYYFYGFYFEKIQESCNITIEQIPEYQGALVSDGVDDYGLCENFPILNSTDGYTILAIRKWLRAPLNNESFLSNTVNASSLDGGFLFEYHIGEDCYTRSFGYTNGLTAKGIDFPEMFSYQKTLEYNANVIAKGTYSGINTLTLFNISKDSNFYGEIALYAFKILNKDCTTEEIKFIAKQMVAKHKEKTGETIELNF